MKEVRDEKKWPLPRYDKNDDPHFLFIITPPFAGSTALSELLNTSHRAMILQERGEGQWLVPGLCEKDRWNPEKNVDYASVKAVWLSKYQQVKRLVHNIDVVIEKSPPNMVRIEKLAAQFRNVSFLANNRNPYANCASILYRNHDADRLNPAQRKHVLSDLTRDWVRRSKRIRALISRLKVPLLTYEAFCHNPSSVLNLLQLPDGVSETIDVKAKVKVKDYKIQSIIDQNERQIAKLLDEEIEHVSRLLISSSELLAFFGYDRL